MFGDWGRNPAEYGVARGGDSGRGFHIEGDCTLEGTDWVDGGDERLWASTALRGGAPLVACDPTAATFGITDSILDELRSALSTS